MGLPELRLTRPRHENRLYIQSSVFYVRSYGTNIKSYCFYFIGRLFIYFGKDNKKGNLNWVHFYRKSFWFIAQQEKIKHYILKFLLIHGWKLNSDSQVRLMSSLFICLFHTTYISHFTIIIRNNNHGISLIFCIQNNHGTIKTNGSTIHTKSEFLMKFLLI